MEREVKMPTEYGDKDRLYGVEIGDKANSGCIEGTIEKSKRLKELKDKDPEGWEKEVKKGHEEYLEKVTIMEERDGESKIVEIDDKANSETIREIIATARPLVAV